MKAILFALCLVTASLALSVPTTKLQPAKAKSQEWCTICQFVIGYIEGEVANNRTEENIISVVQSLCDIIPGSLKHQCKRLIQVYGEDIINLLVNDEPASVVCSQIDLCDSLTKPQHVQAKDSGDCQICEFLISYVYSAIGSNNTEANIEQVLDTVCDIVPSAFKAQCTSLINSYTSQLIQYLLNEETPQAICTQVGLCSSTKVIKIEAPRAGPYCTICEFVMSTADQYLADNSTDQQIILFVENLCWILPSTAKKECDNLIATYSTEIIALLIQDYPPNVVCTEIQLCTTANRRSAAPLGK